jgi:prephenate dehydrogenase
MAVIGVGLIGGSVALAAKAADEATRVVGVGRRRTSLDRAVAAGAVDEVTLDPAEGVAGADVVVLAAPLDAYPAHLEAIAGALADGAMVTDVGSVKAPAVAAAEAVLGPGGPFVGSHPMAGGERTGVEFARADLFVHATCVVTPTERTPPELADRAEAFWRELGGLTLRMSPAEHDLAVARVSHLPHLLASLIVAAQDERSIDLAGGGFMDATRIASGSPEMWRQIALHNREAVLAALDDAGTRLADLRRLIDDADGPAIERFLAHAKTRRDDLVHRRLRRQE